jgi:integrase
MKEAEVKDIPKGTKLRKTYRYEVDGRPLGQKRKRFKHGDKKSAELYAIEITSNARKVAASNRSFISDDLLKEATEGAQKLAPFGKSIADAIEFYIQHLTSESEKDLTSISEVANQRLSKMLKEGKTRQHINKTKSIWDKLSNAFDDAPISSLTVDDLEFWIDSFEFNSSTTKANYRTALNILFNHALKRGIITNNVAQSVAEYEKRTSTDFLTPEQVSQLLSHCPEEIIPAIAICFFCGIRPDYLNGEISRLDWKDIRLHKKVIRLDGRKTKTKEFRTVNIEPNLVAWLEPHAKAAGLVGANKSRFRRLWEQARKDAGLWGANWPHDATRNSFATYHIELYGNEFKTATQTGHGDVKTLRKNYKDLTDKEDAIDYFSITPATVANIIPLRANA